jgi:hypothetical protein
VTQDDPKQPYGWHASEDPEAYERACLEAVQRAVRGEEEMSRNEPWPRIIHDVRLQGEYPETEIVVDVERVDRRAALVWRLHGDDFGTPAAPGYQDWPLSVADQVLIQVLEFGP